MKRLILLAALLCSTGVYAKGTELIYTGKTYSYVLDEYSLSRTGDSVSYTVLISGNGGFLNVTELGNCRNQTHVAILTNGALANASGNFKMQHVNLGTPADLVLKAVCHETEQ